MNLQAFFHDIGSSVRAMFAGPSDPQNVYRLNGRVPLKRAIPFGLQHVFTMFAANVTPFLIIFTFLRITDSPEAKSALMAALLIAGFGTLVQLLVGSRLPMVIGTSFTFIPIFFVIGSSVQASGGTPLDAYYTMLCSSFIGGLFVAVYSLFYKFWGRLIKPIVPGIVVLGIGLSLLSAGATDFLGGSALLSYMAQNGGSTGGAPYYLYILVAFLSLAGALCWNLFVPGVYKNLNIMFGILFGYLISCFITIFVPGFVDFSSLSSIHGVGPNGWIGAPSFVNPALIFSHFSWVPTIMTTLCFVASTVESIGDSSSIAEMGLGRKVTSREVTGTLVCDGFNSALGSLFGSLPLTTFSQNVGLVAQTKIVNRFTVFIGACFLILASFFPPIAAFIYSIPSCVIGGCIVILFGSIAVIGMKMCGEAGWSDKNILILSLVLCLGFGVSIAGDFTSAMTAIEPYLGGFFQNNVILMFIVGFILSWILPDSMEVKLFHRLRKSMGAKASETKDLK